MAIHYDRDADVKCPFYEKGAAGFIQCADDQRRKNGEGFEGVDSVKLLFRNKKTGSPNKDKCDTFSANFCESCYKQCIIYQILMEMREDETL